MDLKVTQEELEKQRHMKKAVRKYEKRIQYIYENGEPSYLEILINQRIFQIFKSG